MEHTNGHERLPLYAGEVLDTIHGFPTIYHYLPAIDIDAQNKPKPLIVCVPGGLGLARIFYGGHEGSKPSDFLAYWLAKQGHGVLSLSYPLETKPEIMPLTAVDFRIEDWGRQAALTAQKILQEKALATRSVILISWSMGGRMITRFNIAAKELGLDVQQYVSLAATPGISSIRPLPPGMVCSSAGYFHVPSHLEVFYKQLKEMEALNGGREIIPREIFLREYSGGSPINLIGLKLKYDGIGAFIPAEKTHEEDTRVFDVENLPFISALYPTSILDYSHAMADQATWGFLLTYKLENMIMKEGLSRVKDTQKWPQLLDLVHSAPKRFCVGVPGNHYLFVGKKSAQNVAERMVKLVNEASVFQEELRSLLL